MVVIDERQDRQASIRHDCDATGKPRNREALRARTGNRLELPASTVPTENETRRAVA